MDYIKASPVDSQVVSEVLGELEKMTVNHGRRHNYLGIVLDYETKAAAKITSCDGWRVKNTIATMFFYVRGLDLTCKWQLLF